MENGIILNNDGSELTDDCGNPIRIIVTTDGMLAIQHNSVDGGRLSRTQVVLDEDVVELLRNRLNS